MKNDNFKCTLINLDKAVMLKPNDGLSYYYRGFSKYKLGRYTEAIADFGKTVEYDHKNAVTYNAYEDRGLCKYALAQYAEAVPDFDQAINYFNRAVTKAVLRSFLAAMAGAITTTNVNLELKATFYNNCGLAKNKIGRYKDAVADFDHALALDPKGLGSIGNIMLGVNAGTKVDLSLKAALHNNRGYAKTQLGLYKDAIADFDDAIKLAPQFTLAYFNRGLAYYKWGNSKANYQKAVADYDMAVQLGGSSFTTPVQYRDDALAAMDKPKVQ